MSQLSANLIGVMVQDDVVGAVAHLPEVAPHVDERPIVIAVIDRQTLDRECLVSTLATSSPDRVAVGYASVDAWLQASDRQPWIVLYRTGRGGASETESLRQLVKEAGQAPVIVIGASDDVSDMIEAFDHGAKGYIPSSVGVATIVEATRMSLANGVFLPMASLQSLRSAVVGSPKPSVDADEAGHFTERQLAVCQALRRGKSNKVIAYELNLCESTVKVHIRTIMKKLRATNRTEAAFKLNTVYLGDKV